MGRRALIMCFRACLTDVYPRYHTMRGRLVERKGGWDCHGLPVEIAVEQKLGITTKAEIEDESIVGIERFNAECRESVFAYLQDWNRLTERIGFWIDLDDAYRTLDETYIESVWWALAQIDRRGLLYEGHKVVPYCYRCGTALSSHEVALGYRDVVDRTVYVRLPVFFPTQEQSGGLVQQPGGPAFAPAQASDSAAPLQQGDELLIWTTTPWTLPGNVAVGTSRPRPSTPERKSKMRRSCSPRIASRLFRRGCEGFAELSGPRVGRTAL